MGTPLTRRLLSLAEAANLLKLSRSTLYKYAERSEIPHIKIGGRIRFSQDELEAWIKVRSIEEIRS
jgi:excisionase family DNA binding protein